MSDDKTTASSKINSGTATMLFGLSPQEAAVTALTLGEGSLIIGDCRHLTAAQLAETGAMRIICSLFAPNTAPNDDAISVIEALCDAGFRGEIAVLAPPLLRPKMVETELRGLARGMRLRLLAGSLAPLHEI